jgi:hypothetical protein
MRRFDVLDRAGELKLPTLILHGFYDVQFPLRQALILAVRVPDSLVKVLNTGHEAPAEDPQAVARAIGSFLQTTWSASEYLPDDGLSTCSGPVHEAGTVDRSAGRGSAKSDDLD